MVEPLIKDTMSKRQPLQRTFTLYNEEDNNLDIKNVGSFC